MASMVCDEAVRTFTSGATRNLDYNKYDMEGFLNPLVLQRFGEYMHHHRTQPDGKIRDSDNWQLGIPKGALIKSAWRHFMDWWLYHRGYKPKESIEEALCALLFNTQGYLLEILKERNYTWVDQKEVKTNQNLLETIVVDCQNYQNQKIMNPASYAKLMSETLLL